MISQETEKVALAETTGLDQKQINNWFINQRKRHWKPSEDMQFMVMDGLHPQNAALYMESHYMGDGAYRLGPWMNKQQGGIGWIHYLSRVAIEEVSLVAWSGEAGKLLVMLPDCNCKSRV